MAQRQDEGWYSDVTRPVESRQSNAGSLVLGVILVIVGTLFLVREFTGPNFWHWAWPLIVVAAGGLLFAGLFAGGKPVSGLAIPASIVTTTGLILLFQNTFHLWQTWAYAWALVVPTSVGLGIWVMGWLEGKPRPQEVGRRMAEIGFVIFLGFAAFFELIVNLSGLWHGTSGAIVAAILILGGAYILTRPKEEPFGR